MYIYIYESPNLTKSMAQTDTFLVVGFGKGVWTHSRIWIKFGKNMIKRCVEN